MRLPLAGVLLGLLIAACATTQYRVSPGAQRTPFRGRVLVFDQQVPPAVNYAVIGEFVEQKQWYGGTDETKGEALHAAGQKGANAVLIEETGHRANGWSWAAPFTQGKLLWVKNYEEAAAQSSGKAASSSTSQRLRELDDLHRQGLVNDSEYEAKRAAIINSL
jgi:hypothetical protein